MNLIPNIPPKLFSLSAVAVGYLLIDDTTANEQNALGNWLMLVAQILCTNAFYKQVMQERGLNNTKSSNGLSGDNTDLFQSLIQTIKFNRVFGINLYIQQPLINISTQQLFQKPRLHFYSGRNGFYQFPTITKRIKNFYLVIFRA